MSGKIRLSTKSVQTQSVALKEGEIEKKWVLFDAEGVILGRLAAVIVPILRGKNKPTFTPSVDCGDMVIVVNADKVAMTGKKATEKLLHRHTGHPGGIKSQTRASMLVGPFPERVIEKAIERMMPRGPLGRRQMGNLKVYAGAEHPHAAQKPTKIDFASANAKNKRER